MAVLKVQNLRFYSGYPKTENFSLLESDGRIALRSPLFRLAVRFAKQNRNGSISGQVHLPHKGVVNLDLLPPLLAPTFPVQGYRFMNHDLLHKLTQEGGR